MGCGHVGFGGRWGVLVSGLCDCLAWQPVMSGEGWLAVVYKLGTPCLGIVYLALAVVFELGTPCLGTVSAESATTI